MSFQPFTFTYTPPSTVSSPTVNSPAINTTSIPSLPKSNSSTSTAGQLIAKANTLLQTNLYLQQVILSKSQGLGITLDYSVYPEVGQAFSTLYPNLDIPSVITTNMYNRTLDAEIGAMQINSGLGINNSLEVNNLEVGACSQINNFVETSLASSGTFSSSVPLLLGNLKGDVVVLNNIVASLSTYPVVESPSTTSISTLQPSNLNVISMSGQDISSSLATTIENHLSAVQSSYASTYQLVAGTGTVNQNINTIIATCSSEPVVNLIRIGGILTNLKNSIYPQGLKNIKGDLNSSSFIVLISELIGICAIADQFSKNAITPLKGITSSIGQIISSLNQEEVKIATKTSGVVGSSLQQTGPLQGMSLFYNNGLPINTKSVNSSLSNINSGLLSIGAHINFGISTAQNTIKEANLSLQKLLNRTNNMMNDMLNLLASLQDIDAMMGVITALISYKQSEGNNSVSSNNTTSPIQVVGQLISSDNSYTINNGVLQSISPSIPAPTTLVKNSLISGGLSIISPITTQETTSTETTTMPFIYGVS